MAYDGGARSSPSQPDPLRRDQNPWQDQNNSNFLGGNHGNTTYQEPPVHPQLDPSIQDADEGWSEWPGDWGIDDSEECMPNGYSNGFVNEANYLPRHQITTTQPQPQNSGFFFNQFVTPNQPQPKQETAPLNSFFDNVHLTNPSNNPGSAQSPPQDSMASSQNTNKRVPPFGCEPTPFSAELATVRTGISYADALSGSAETPGAEENNTDFDDINLNENADAGLQPKGDVSEREPSLPAASFSPFPSPMPEKMQRSAAHLFSKPTVSRTPHDFFGNVSTPSSDNNSTFCDEETSITQAEQQSNYSPQESSGVSDPSTLSTVEQRSSEMPSQQSKWAIETAFGVHTAPITENVHPNIEESFSSNQPFTFATEEERVPEMPLQQSQMATENAFGDQTASSIENVEQRSSEMPSQQSKWAIDNAFGVQTAPITENVHPNIEESFSSNQPFTFATEKERAPEMPLQQSQMATENAFGDQTASSIENVHPNIEESFSSNQPFTFANKEKRSPEMSLQQSQMATADAFADQTASSIENVRPHIEESFSSNQPFTFASEEERSPEMSLQHSQMANDNAFADQTGPSIENVYPDLEESFSSNQPFTFPTEEERTPEMPLKQSHVANDNFFRDHSDPPYENVHPTVEESLHSNKAFTFATVEQRGTKIETMNSFEVHTASSNESLRHNIEESFTSSQAFSSLNEEQRTPQMPLQQSQVATNNDIRVVNAPSTETVNPNVNASISSDQPFLFPTEEEREPEIPLQQCEDASSIQKAFEVDGSFINQTPGGSYNDNNSDPTSKKAIDSDANTIEDSHQMVPDIEKSFSLNQAAVSAVEQRSSAIPFQQPKQGSDIEDHFGVVSPSDDDQDEPIEALNQMAWKQEDSLATTPVEPLQDSPQNVVASKGTALQMTWQPVETIPEPFSHASDAIHLGGKTMSDSSAHDTRSSSEQSQVSPTQSNIVPPPPMNVVEKENNIEESQEQSAPSAIPVQISSITVAKKEENVPSRVVHEVLQPVPPPQIFHPSVMTAVKPGKEVRQGGSEVQSPPMALGKSEEVPNKDGHQQYQEYPPTGIAQPPVAVVKSSEELPIRDGPEQYHVNPSRSEIKPPPLAVAETEKESPINGDNHQYQEYAYPPTSAGQPLTMVVGTVEDNMQQNVWFQQNQSAPPTNAGPPLSMAMGKKEDNISRVDLHNSFQPALQPNMSQAQLKNTKPLSMADRMNDPLHEHNQPAPPSDMVLRTTVANSKRKENNPRNDGHEHNYAPPTNMMPPMLDTVNKPSPDLYQPAPASNVAQAPPMTIGKKDEPNPRNGGHEHNYTPPTNVMPFSYNVDNMKKPPVQQNQHTPPASTAPFVPRFPKDAHIEHTIKPEKFSTPEPSMLPESGPMAMTKRPSREEKSRTPVPLSSSLWSNATAMSPSIMLAPALKPTKEISSTPPMPPTRFEAPETEQDLTTPQQLQTEQETKVDASVTLSKKERKAEKKRLKALKKQQKKLKKEGISAAEKTNSPIHTGVSPDGVQTSHQTSSDFNDSRKLMKNPQHLHESVDTPPRENPHHEKVTREVDENEHSDFVNLHGGRQRTDFNNPRESIHQSSRSEYHLDKNVVKDSEYGMGNVYGEQQLHYKVPQEDVVEKTIGHRHRSDEHHHYYSNPRVWELRDESPSRHSDHLSHRDNIHRHGDQDLYYDPYSGSYAHRTSQESLNERSFNSKDGYSQRHDGDFRHTVHREYGDHYDQHYSSEYEGRREKDYRYSGNRRDIDKYRNNDTYDQYKRDWTRAEEFDYYASRRSHEDLSYLNHSNDGHSEHGRRSSREEHDSYRNYYYKDSVNRGHFKPINDLHYPEYREHFRSNTPSSGSGRSSPVGYGYGYQHDPYYGYRHPPHAYPGYEHHYGYYPGPYGMHYPYPHGYYPGYGPYYDYYNQYGTYGSGQNSQYSSGEGSYRDSQVIEGQSGELALERDQEETEVQEIAPIRTTPLHFLRPHMSCKFGPGGQLLVTLPNHPDDGQRPLVEISMLKAIFSAKQREQIFAFPGPLSCRGTIKRQVIEYVQAKADEIQESSTDPANQQARWVLWKYLLSCIKHNGAVVAEDIAEILMLSVQYFEKKKKTKKKRHQSEDSSTSDSSSDDDSSNESSSESSESSEESSEVDETKPVDDLLVYRALLLEGKTKEAIEYAMNNNLWGHAVLLGGLMDTKANTSMLDSKTSSSIISRFFETMKEEDPLKTVYEHLGGKVPHAVRHYANWASNLAGIIANPTAFPDKDKENIIALGDTLAKHSNLLEASHLCYLLAGLKPGTPGTNSKIMLVGCEHRYKKYDQLDSIEALHLTELFEYANSLQNPEFFLPGLQMFRYFHATKLIDAGFHKEALGYLQFVGDLIIKHPHLFNDTMKKNLYKTSEQLVGHMEKSGTKVDMFVLSWLKKFNNMMEGKDSGISLPQNETESTEDEEDLDPMAQSSMSYSSGYNQPLVHDEANSPDSSFYTHNTVSRKESVQSTHSVPSVNSSQTQPIPSVPTHNTVSRQASLQCTQSVPSVNSLQTLDLYQQPGLELYQPREPIEHKDSLSSQGYLDQNDGSMVQELEYQPDGPTESVDPWRQQQQQPQGQQGEKQFGNQWMGDQIQQDNSWMLPSQEVGHEISPEDGEMTPVNAPDFDDFYRQANPLSSSRVTWEEAKTPTPSMPDSSRPNKDASESPEKEETSDTKPAKNNKTGQSSGFWTGITGLVKTLIPLGPKEIHLPDDKKKTIYFDKELNKWINTEEKEEDKAPPPPPPSDAMIGGMGGPPALGPRPGGNPMSGVSQGMAPSNPLMPVTGTMNTKTEPVPDNNRVGPGSPSVPGTTGNQQSLPEMLPGMNKPGVLPGPPSKFSRKAQGRLGTRNKYVDVLNPNKGIQPSSQAIPSALFPVMPTGSGSFQGTLFVPSAAPVDNDGGNSSSLPPTDIQSGPENPQPPSPTDQDGDQPQFQQPTFFDPSNFQPPTQSSSLSRRGRGRYPGGYKK